MKNNTHRRLDAFTFSLGGASVASSYGPITVVANDRIAKAWDQRLKGGTPASISWSRLVPSLPRFMRKGHAV